MPDIVTHILLPLLPAMLGQPYQGEAADTPAAQHARAVLADELDLGTKKAAGRLLVAAPDSRWVEEAAASADDLEQPMRWPVAGGRFVRGVGHSRKHLEHVHHDGVDIAAEPGTPVVAAADGLVAYAGDEVSGFGNLVGIVHADGTVSLYAHLQSASVVAGQRVHQGQPIGEVGNTGLSRGPHLHFEWRRRGRPQDPLPELARWLQTMDSHAKLANAGDIALRANGV